MKIDTVNASSAPALPVQKPAVAVNGVSVADTKSGKVNPIAVTDKQNGKATPVSVADTKNGDDTHLAKVVKNLNKEAETLNREVRFAIFDGTHRVMIEVVDKQTNQVVATFPPKQILKMAAAMDKETADSNKTAPKEVK
ncbi:MAG: flagellar protein FlaG [Negativicutes bacterium]|nr:flagellar protein FlaG [Negativicutes bacterium]